MTGWKESTIELQQALDEARDPIIYVVRTKASSPILVTTDEDLAYERCSQVEAWGNPFVFVERWQNGEMIG